MKQSLRKLLGTFLSCSLFHVSRNPQTSLILFLRYVRHRDLKDIDSPDPAVRAALADEIRDACMNVGFLYGGFEQEASINMSSRR